MNGSRFRLYFVRALQIALILFLALIAGLPAHADRQTLYDTPRFTLYMPAVEVTETTAMEDLAKNSIAILNSTYEELSELFGAKPQTKAVLRFLSPEDFRKHTRAPSWTSAMFLNGEISIPIPRSRRVNQTELTRAVRHEYVHAVISELSGKGCPAWVDEGLAQIFEGDPNPLLGPALRRWIAQNEALPLDWLQNGFLTLNDDLVPVAYAQSLFATRYLVEKMGYPSMNSYFGALRKGTPQPEAFRSAFGMDERSFERTLTAEMRLWTESGKIHP